MKNLIVVSWLWAFFGLVMGLTMGVAHGTALDPCTTQSDTRAPVVPNIVSEAGIWKRVLLVDYTKHELTEYLLCADKSYRLTNRLTIAPPIQNLEQVEMIGYVNWLRQKPGKQTFKIYWISDSNAESSWLTISAILTDGTGQTLPDFIQAVLNRLSFGEKKEGIQVMLIDVSVAETPLVPQTLVE